MKYPNEIRDGIEYEVVEMDYEYLVLVPVSDSKNHQETCYKKSEKDYNNMKEGMENEKVSSRSNRNRSNISSRSNHSIGERQQGNEQNDQENTRREMGSIQREK